MNSSRCSSIYVVIALLVFSAANLRAESASSHRTERIRLSDGVELVAEVYLPATGNKHPVILVRTPYTRGQFGESLAEPLAKRGFAVVLQDVRGMGDSQGTFIPFINERKDGLETLDWLTKQVWCNGKVGMWGASYLGYCSLILAPEQHPALKTIFDISGWSNSYEMTSPGGANHLMLNLPWTLSGQIRGQEAQIDWAKAFRHVPVTQIPNELGLASQPWEAASRLFSAGVLIQSASISGRYDRVRIPIFYFTGWHDMIARNVLDTYERIDAASSAPTFQKLMVGPWHHDQQWFQETRVGDEDFGPAAAMGISKIVDLTARWFDHWLKDIDNGVDREPAVDLFVMGPNKWRSFDHWPPRTAKEQAWYLASTDGANSVHGDGSLTAAAPAISGRDTFVFDPLDPVPTLGGANCHFFEETLGVRDQRPAEERQDVLVYTSTPLQKPITIVGPLRAVVYAATEGRHMDVTAKLVAVRPDGYARIIDEGIKRGPDTAQVGKIEPLEPGKVSCYTIEMGKTAITVPTGQRLRVEISSSNFPKYTRNPNTGESPESATDFKAARETVFHSKEFPSHVVLPILAAETPNN